MYLIGLTGGIASGKTTVAHRLAELGAVHLDADQIARAVVEPGTPALAAIVAAFGPSVLQEDGALDRARLGERVFQDAEALARLNAIVHPAVAAHTRQRLAQLAEADPEGVVVYDVPLLVEAAVDHPWDLIVVAHAPAPLRLQRLMELRGLDRDEAERRIAAQASDAQRLAVADAVIDTAQSLEQTRAQVDALWQRISERSVRGSA